MNTKRIRNCLLAAAMAAGLGTAPAAAGYMPVALDAPDAIVFASDNCYAVGAAVAADNGGKLAAVRHVKSGGKNVCVVVVLIPGKDGQRPRRKEFVIPQ